MKKIFFLLIGDQNVDTAALVDIYMWQVHFGYAYHDHQLQHTRYQISIFGISSCQQLEHVLLSKDSSTVIIHFICFNTTKSDISDAPSNNWLPEVLKLLAGSKEKIFLVAFKNDSRRSALAKLFLQNNNEHIEFLKTCQKYLNNRFEYLECCSLEVKHVERLFESAVKIVVYDSNESKEKCCNKISFGRYFNKCNCFRTKYNKLIEAD